MRAGLAKVFWGVAESRHLVDVINQTDLVENLDGEAKLGQPLLSGSVIRDWGTVDLFLLPYFRTRTFPGTKGRLRSQFVVDDDTVRFDSRAGRHRVDWAIRYTHTLGSWDVGVSHFNGNSREPMLVPTLRPDGSRSLIAKYSVINQTGLDVQATLGNWLWKFEGIHTSGNGRTFNGLVGGFEFTAVGIADTALDLGIIVEYLYDDRGKRAPHPFESDVFFGTRVAFNDEPSTELLAGLIRDLNGSATAFNVEANRRLGVSWTAEVELRAWAGVDSSDLQHALRRDDYVQLTLKRYF